MKRLFTIVLCVLLMLILSSCQKNDNVSNIDDPYLEGIAQGEKNAFLNLFNASPLNKALTYGEVWETDDFSISFSDLQVESTYAYDNYEHILNCKLTLNNFTIDEVYEEKNIYLGIYSRTADGQWSEVVSDYEYYYMSTILDDNYTWGDYSAEADFQLYDNPKYVVAIIVIDGNLYKVSYHCQA